jgi:hypothetical protein
MDLVGEATVRPPSSVAEIVAIPIVHDWGPLGSVDGPQEIENFGEFDGLFGNGESAGRDAVQGAFVGPGVAGRPTAGAVIVYRMATGSAAKAAVTLKNTKEAPENALTLTAKYTGERGNRFSVKTEADPLDAEKDRLTILFDGVKQESYSYAETDITALAAAINARSDFVTATSLKTGTTLATVSGTAFTAGNNGASLTAEQWTDALSALEFEDFSVISPFDLVDDEIVASLYSWVQTQAEEQRPVTAVLGGAEDEDLSTAMEEVEEIRDPHIIRLAGGLFHDEYLDKDLSTSQLAPRVAGALAGCGEESSLTFCPFAGIKQVGTVSIAVDELAVAATAGLTVFRRASRADGAEMVIAKGVTTFNDLDDPTRPYELFSDPRIVRVADLFQRRMKTYGDEHIVGPTRVTDTTKAAVRQQGQAEINDLLDRGLIQGGATPEEKPYFRIVDDPGPNLQDAIVYEFGFKFARTTLFLIGSGKVR